MALRSRFCAMAMLVSLIVVAPFSTAHAGQLFPPQGMSPTTNACPDNTALVWSSTGGGQVACAPASSLVSTTGSVVETTTTPPAGSIICPAGEVMVGMQNGSPICRASTLSCMVVQNQENGAPGDYGLNVSCPSGYTVTGGGAWDQWCDGCGVVSAPNGSNGWTTGAPSDEVVYAVCCKIQ
jgi:hypothetical protein